MRSMGTFPLATVRSSRDVSCVDYTYSAHPTHLCCSRRQTVEKSRLLISVLTLKLHGQGHQPGLLRLVFGQFSLPCLREGNFDLISP